MIRRRRCAGCRQRTIRPTWSCSAAATGLKESSPGWTGSRAAAYLSDLKPLHYEHKPFVGGAWPLVNDGSVTGHELRLAGSTFDKGLGLHSESRVTYALSGKYQWFEARVGLDPERGKKGRVRIRVLLDGRETDLGWNKELTAKDEPLLLRIDVHQGKELTL